jgi:hypothetical protein
MRARPGWCVVSMVELDVAGAEVRQGLAGSEDGGVDKQLEVEDGDVRAMCDVRCAASLCRAAPNSATGAHGQADLASAVRR